jgi:hypothetical protein
MSRKLVSSAGTAQKRIACNQILFGLLGSEKLVHDWWFSPNRAFDQATPDSVWLADPKLVISYLLNQMQTPY